MKLITNDRTLANSIRATRHCHLFWSLVHPPSSLLSLIIKTDLTDMPLAKYYSKICVAELLGKQMVIILISNRTCGVSSFYEIKTQSTE